MDTKELLRFTIDNIAKYGDTDIFPHQFENQIFNDSPNEVVCLLEQIHKEFEEFFLKVPFIYLNTSFAVGDKGYGSATQIDPIWNAYLLFLTLSIGEDIENARIPTDMKTVFSYRFKPDVGKKTIFDPRIGWKEYQVESVRLAREHEYVVACDISDFYIHIYHHHIENALKHLTNYNKPKFVSRIKKFLTKLSGGASYGLPVGGPAARLLSEALLNNIDQLLITSKIKFCRFVDDFHIFAESETDARMKYNKLCELLRNTEGLSIQSYKTKLIAKDKFLSSSPFAEEFVATHLHEKQTLAFLKLPLQYDPYSSTTYNDYDSLKDDFLKIDLSSMLESACKKELEDRTLIRKLIRTIKFLDPEIRDLAVLLIAEHFTSLYPVFPSVMIFIKSIISQLDVAIRAKVFKSIHNLIINNSHITAIPVNLLFAIRVLAFDDSNETSSLLETLYNKNINPMINRDIILIMARHNNRFWVSYCRRSYSLLTPWELRAILISSYILGDEGRHWRNNIKKELDPMNKLAIDWAAKKVNSGILKIPI